MGIKDRVKLIAKENDTYLTGHALLDTEAFLNGYYCYTVRVKSTGSTIPLVRMDTPNMKLEYPVKMVQVSLRKTRDSYVIINQELVDTETIYTSPFYGRGGNGEISDEFWDGFNDDLTAKFNDANDKLNEAKEELENSISELDNRITNPADGLIKQAKDDLTTLMTTKDNIIKGYSEAIKGVYTDNDGRISGWTLYVEGVEDNPSTIFSVVADKFFFFDGDSDKPLFAAGEVNGVNTFGINGNLLVDGSIVANKLAIGRGVNILMNSSWSAGYKDWSVTATGDAYSGYVSSYGDNGYYDTYNMFSDNLIGALSLVSEDGSGGSISVESRKYIVDKSSKFYLASVYHGSIGSPSFNISVLFYDSNDNNITTAATSVSTTTDVVDLPGIDLTRKYKIVEIPATAATVSMKVEASGSSFVHIFSQAQLEVATSSTAKPSPYGVGGATLIDGGYIVSDSIEARHIKAGEIDSTKIKAKSLIASDVLVPGTLIANEIIVPGSISANEINVKSLTTSLAKIDDAYINRLHLEEAAIAVSSVSSNDYNVYIIADNNLRGMAIDGTPFPVLPVGITNPTYPDAFALYDYEPMIGMKIPRMLTRAGMNGTLLVVFTVETLVTTSSEVLLSVADGLSAPMEFEIVYEQTLQRKYASYSNPPMLSNAVYGESKNSSWVNVYVKQYQNQQTFAIAFPDTKPYQDGTVWINMRPAQWATRNASEMTQVAEGIKIKYLYLLRVTN